MELKKAAKKSVRFYLTTSDIRGPMPTITKTSEALSKDLKKRGWKFFGPTTTYAFMQTIGLVNDHIEGCAIRELVESARREFVPPCCKEKIA